MSLWPAKRLDRIGSVFFWTLIGTLEVAKAKENRIFFVIIFFHGPKAININKYKKKYARNSISRRPCIPLDEGDHCTGNNTSDKF